MEDQTIIHLYWSRSQEAIDETSKKYSAYCFKISMNILENKQDADECTNDTYLNAWNSIPPHRPNVLSTFLGKITRNLSLDRYKRERAKKRGGGQLELALSELEECICSSRNLERELDFKCLTDTLNEFLNTLSNEKRIIFNKRYWYMMPIKDIACELNMSESKIKSTLFGIRKTLKSVLESEGYFE